MVAPAAHIDEIGSSPGGPARTVRLGRFLAQVPEIVAAVLDRIDDELPELGSASWRDRAAEDDLLRFLLRRRLELCERGSGFEPDDLAFVGGHFADIARRGAPLPLVQQFFRASIANTFIEMWARAEPGDVNEILRLSRWLSRHNPVLERLLVQVYCELMDPGRRHADQRAALAERLLAGVTGEAPDGIDWKPAPAYLVVVAARGESEPEQPRGALSVVKDGRRVLLLPVEDRFPRPEVWAEASRWVAAQDGVRAAGVFADSPAEVPSAAATARRLAHAAAAIGLAPGLVGQRELILESTLVHQREGLTRLAAVLDPIDVDPRLVETLATFFSNDLDRTRTAAALFLSRGGLSLRLDRIAQLTGLDPRTTRGIQVLGSALSARALLDVEAAERESLTGRPA
ncbi:MAG TPA: helix-turn-helix domain-containing protein [Pseudonocardia sp.]|nr:helix-turn-helix domain-containing protein [Pseudonocardia sp.]